MPRRSRTGLTDELLRRFDVVTAAYAATQSTSLIDPGISLSQLKAMYVIRYRGRVRVGQLGKMLGLSPNGTTVVLDGLEAAGRVRRDRDPDDRRALLVTMTAEGDQWLANIQTASLQRFQELLNSLTVEELQALDLGLAGLERAIAERAPADTCDGRTEVGRPVLKPDAQSGRRLLDAR